MSEQVENLGELPSAYHDDAVAVLVKNPRTLFVYWDFAPGTLEAGFSGLADPRAVLRIFDGPRLVREMDVHLDAKSWYVHELVPDRDYRIEIHALGSDGKGRRLGRSSNTVHPPPSGVSSIVDDRFVRIGWDEPLAEGTEVVAPAAGPRHAEAANLSGRAEGMPSRPWSGEHR